MIIATPTQLFFPHTGSQWLWEELRRERKCLLRHNMVIWYITSPGTGGAHQYLDLRAPVLMGLGRLTCFVGYCVGFGHRLLITQIDRGAPLKARTKWEKSECCQVWMAQATFGARREQNAWSRIPTNFELQSSHSLYNYTVTQSDETIQKTAVI